MTVLRVVAGGLFVGHGMQKLNGSFGGHGLEATGRAFDSMGLRPGRTHATAAGVAEAGGGALLAAGFLTPVAASALTGTMAMAIHKVHAKNGPWVGDNGWEYNAVLLAAVFAITAEGPGALSLDWFRDADQGSLLAAIGQLAAGAGGAYALLKATEAGLIPGSPADAAAA
jgi:putative oxidoreductase